MSKIISKYIFIAACIVVLIPYLSISDNSKKVILTLTGVFLLYIYFRIKPKKRIINSSFTEKRPNEESSSEDRWQDIKEF